MLEGQQSKIIFNLNESLEIPRQFPKIGCLNPNVFKSITNEPFQYEIQSNINGDSIRSFIDYLIGKKELDLDSDNFLEYFFLSQEFGILKDYKQILKNKLQIIEDLIKKQQYQLDSIQDLKSQIEDLKRIIHLQQVSIQNNSNSIKDEIENFKNSIINSVDEKITQQNQQVNRLVESRNNYNSLREEITNLMNEISTSLDQHKTEQNSKIENLNSRINSQFCEFKQQINHQNEESNNMNQKLEVWLQQNSQKFITKDQLRSILIAGSSGEYLPFVGEQHYFQSFDYDKRNPNLATRYPIREYYKGQWLKDWERALRAIPP